MHKNSTNLQEVNVGSRDASWGQGAVGAVRELRAGWALGAGRLGGGGAVNDRPRPLPICADII